MRHLGLEHAWYVHENVIVDFVFVATAATIDFEETVIDECLAVTSESEYVHDEGYVKEHVSTEDEGARIIISKG